MKSMNTVTRARPVVLQVSYEKFLDAGISENHTCDKERTYIIANTKTFGHWTHSLSKDNSCPFGSRGVFWLRKIDHTLCHQQ